MTPEQAVIAAIGACLAGAALTAVASRSRAVAGGLAVATATVAAALVLAAIGQVVTGGPSPEAAAPLVVPALGFAPRFHVDGLSCVFLLLAALVSVPATLHSVGYLARRTTAPGTGGYYPYLLLFLAAMLGLVTTTDMMWFFLVFWQLMTLPGYALIRFEGGRERIRAANAYLLMMQVACAATLLGAELLVAGRPASAPGPRYDFSAVSAALPELLRAHPLATGVAFALFLVGFGIKMGMWPFGRVWLPDAHPAAPSPVSALLSGVMIKTGVYGLLRYFLWLVPPAARDDFPLAGWGAAIALLGTITLFTGTAQALRQSQTKRLLAFHSIGQIGYVLLGAGTCLALLARGPAAAPVAALGLFAGLLHAVNHGLFKALLFLDAGSLLCATGSQELDAGGGLLRAMPVTGATALVASLAISGVPPLNGFVSKWALTVAAVQGGAPAFESRYLVPCALVAVLTSALTLASFLKFFGLSFLSRSGAALRARALARPLEVGPSMLGPQVFLAVACVAIGLFPAPAFLFLEAALRASPGGLAGTLAGAPVTGTVLSGVSALSGGALLAPLTVAMLLAALLLLAQGLSRVGAAPRRRVEPWLCGYAHDPDDHRSPAHGLYGELTRHLRWLGGAPRPSPGQAPGHLGPGKEP